MPLSKDLREFVELLNSNKVEYLVVGGFAVFYHGFARYTGDIDFLVRASEENSLRVAAALAQFGFGSVDIKAEDFQSSGMVVQLGVPPNRIDIITSISGVSFDEAWDGRIAGILDGVATQFIGREALIRNKESTGRAKDLVDAGELRRRASPKRPSVFGPVTRQQLCQALDLVEVATKELVDDKTFHHSVLTRLRQWHRPDNLKALTKEISRKAASPPRKGAGGAGMNGLTLDERGKPSLESLLLHYAEVDAGLFPEAAVDSVRNKFGPRDGPKFHGPWP
jgi:hypothetical protein